MDPILDQDDRRSAAIAQVMDEALSARASGNKVAHQSIIAAHPDLMPELGHELEKLRRIEEARRAAIERTQGDAGEAAVGRIDDTAELPFFNSRVAGYCILRELNRGGQGTVYLAKQLSTGRKVALKVLRDGPLADDRKLARFQREVKVLAALNHPNIVAIIDTGQTTDGSHYIVMNYISGLDLSKYMVRRQQKDPDDPGKLLKMFLKICDAVNAAHVRGIVHRDLKPANIRVDERGEPHVLDFGLARTPLDGLVTGDEQPLSVTGEFMGSLPWCSPEQAEGNPDKIDVRSDVYSLGVILYQMLTGGRFPYAVVGNIRDVLNNILTAAPTPPSKMVAKAAREAKSSSRPPRMYPMAVNETIERIVLKALSKQPQHRYQSAGEFKKEIANYLLGRQTQAAPRRGGAVARLKMPGRAALVALACALTMSVILAAMFHKHLWHHPAKYVSNSSKNTPLASAPLSPDLVIGQAKSSTIDLLKLIDVQRDAVRGQWRFEGDDLAVPAAAGASRLRLPYKPPAEYDFLIEVTQVDGFNVLQCCSSHDTTFNWAMNGLQRVHGLRAGDDGNPTRGTTSALRPPGHRYQSVVKVRNDRVSAWIDGQKVLDYPTNYSELSVFDQTGVGLDCLGLAATNHVLFHRIEITEISGHGKICHRIFPTAVPAQELAAAPRISLTELKPSAIEAFNGSRPETRLPSDGALVVDGKTCERYLFAGLPTSLRYDVPAEAIAFHAVGVRPTGSFVAGYGNWRYFIYLDGDLAYASRPISESPDPIVMDVSIPPGTRSIELRTGVVGGNADGWATWAYPDFLMSRRPISSSATQAASLTGPKFESLRMDPLRWLVPKLSVRTPDEIGQSSLMSGWRDQRHENWRSL